MDTASVEPEVKRRRRWTLLDIFYFIGVIFKGIDGAIELLVGLIVLFAPGVTHLALSAAAAEVREKPGPIRSFIAGYLDNLDDRLAQSGLGLLIAFLLVHGIVKLVLVYCLLRRLHRVYPYALAVLILFLAYQVYAAVNSPTIGLIVLTVLDAVIIVLVYREYREIKRDEAAAATAEAVAAESATAAEALSGPSADDVSPAGTPRKPPARPRR